MEPPPTLADFAASNRRLHLSCRAPGHTDRAKAAGHHGTTLSAAEAAERWGRGLTLVDLCRRGRCLACGARGGLVIEVTEMPGALSGMGNAYGAMNPPKPPKP